MDKQIYEKIISKKDFSQLPKKDVEKAFSIFEQRQVSDEEKVRLTRDLLRKVFSVFTSRKLLKLKDYDSSWILKKHISTRERFENYQEIYTRIFKAFSGKINVFDLGCGVNGFSYEHFPKKVNYLGVEAIGQLVDLTNKYFEKKNFEKFAKAVHLSLFNLSEVKNLIKDSRGKKIVFLFKVIDSLEMLERNYSKKFLKEIVPLVDKVVISFATKSLIKRRKFRTNKKWLRDFLKENFKIVEKFEFGSEKYLIIEK